MAFFLDLVLVTILAAVVVQAELALQARLPSGTYFFVAALYLGLLPATPLEATLGKRCVGLRICDRSGKRIGLLRSLLRLVAFVPSIGIAGAGFILAAFTPRRQALHDLAAGTFVVNRGAKPDEIAQVPAPVSWMTRIGLVLILVIPALSLIWLRLVFERQRVYEEVVAVWHATKPYRGEVEKALRSGTPMPAAAERPRHARAMSARPDGSIVIEISDELVPGARLTLHPEAVPNGEYLWTCRGEGLRYAPSACR
jgi:uncharacterized RDD family membrane protein YckC